MPRELSLPIADEVVATLRVEDEVELSGWVLTGRDASCARLFQMIQAGRPLPVELSGQILYLVGPTPARPGRVIGSAGPTTAGRMNPFLPAFFAAGLRGLIGKGSIDPTAKEALVRHRGVYFGAVGGAGALLSTAICEVRPVAFEELLSEAMQAMRLDHFPVVVLNDCRGGDLYRQAIGGAS